MAWTPDGRDLVFSYGWSNSGLWQGATASSARPRRLAFASEGAYAPAISRQGNRLAYAIERSDANIWRVDLGDTGQNPTVPARLIASTREERDPAYSPDGRSIAYVSRGSGTHEIWMCRSDGSNPVQLTSIGASVALGPKWSPDGRDIAFSAVVPAVKGQHIYVISANRGNPRRLTTGKWPFWSRDGQSIYFVSNRSGSSQIWKIPAAGGNAVQITPDGETRDVPQESIDGRHIYYLKGWPEHPSVWKAPVAGGEESIVLDSVHNFGGWTVGTKGIYFFTPPDAEGRSEIRLYNPATGETNKILTIDRSVFFWIAVSPDERTILYGQYDQAGSDLMLVENFR
jgi:Tol biopolymer transport system component